MAIKIVDFPINSMVIFQFAMLNYQRVCPFFSTWCHFLVHEDPVEILPSSPKFLHGQPASSGDGSEGIWACMAGSIGGHDSGVDLLEVPIWLLYPPPLRGGGGGGKNWNTSL